MRLFLLKAAAIFVLPTVFAALVALALPVLVAVPPAPVVQVNELAPMDAMPDFVHSAHPEAQHAYRFAAAHQDLLTHFPCYCGCVYMGHTNNLDCYIQNVSTTGAITYDPHAAGCGICVEITNDVARLWGDGTDLETIQDFIVTTYSQRGPST